MRESIYNVLAFILHLGNVKFEMDDHGFAQISNDSYQSMEFAANIVSIDKKQLQNTLLNRTLILPNQDDISLV